MDLLLELLELPEPILSGAAAEFVPTLKNELTGSELLVRHDFEDVTTSMADHEDAPVSLTWSGTTGGLAYFSPSDGPVAVAAEQLQRWRVAVMSVLNLMTANLDLPQAHRPFELLDGLLWEIGDVRLGRSSKRTSTWFARRLWDLSVQQKIAAAARNRPHTRQRVILSSSRSDRLLDVRISGCVLVGLRDILSRSDSLNVSSVILGARLRGETVTSRSGPVELSPDGTRLRINSGDPILFRSELQIAAIRRFVAAFETGARLRAIEITPTGNLSRLFGAQKWKELSPFLRSQHGLWGFEV